MAKDGPPQPLSKEAPLRHRAITTLAALLIILSTAGVVLASGRPAAAAAAAPRVAGNLLVDGTGSRYVIKGTAVYMVPFYTNGTGGPDGALASTTANDFAQRDQIFTYMRSIGINTVRLPLSVSTYGGPDPYGLGGTAGYLQRVSDIVSSANTAGLSVVVGWWDSLGEGDQWPAQHAQSFGLMGDVVHKLGDNPRVMYEPWNEPNHVSGDQWAGVWADTLRLFRTTLGYKGVIFADTTGWSWDFDPTRAQSLLDADASLRTSTPNIVFANHRYANANTSFNGNDQTSFEQSVGQYVSRFPIAGTEYGYFNNFGAPQPTWNSQFLTYLATVSVPHGLNGYVDFVWDWVDPNSMVNANGQQGLTSLNQHGQIAVANFFSKQLTSAPITPAPTTTRPAAPPTTAPKTPPTTPPPVRQATVSVSGSGGSASGYTNAPVVRVPAGARTGDRLVVEISLSASLAVSVPAGWSAVPSFPVTDGGHQDWDAQLVVMSHVLAPGNPSTFSFPISQYGNVAWGVVALRGAHGPVALDASASGFQLGQHVSDPALTARRSGDLALSVVAAVASDQYSLSVSPGWHATAISQPGVWSALGFAWATSPTAGTLAPASWTLGGGSNGAVGVMAFSG